MRQWRQSGLFKHRVGADGGDEAAHATQLEGAVAQRDKGAGKFKRDSDMLRSRWRPHGHPRRLCRSRRSPPSASIRISASTSCERKRAAVVDREEKFRRKRAQRYIRLQRLRQFARKCISVERRCRVESGERRGDDVGHALGGGVAREEGRLRRGARSASRKCRLAHAAQLQLRALREIDEPIAAVFGNRGERRKLRRRDARADRSWRASAGRRCSASARRRRDTSP